MAPSLLRLRRSPAQQSLGFEVSPHARIRRTLAVPAAPSVTRKLSCMQLGGPARVLAVLRGQCLHGLGRQTREATDVATHLIAQRPHRIGGPFGGVIPAFDRREAEADLKPGERMTPGLGGQRVQRVVQFPGGRRCGQQRSDDREAQPRPAISLR